MPTFYFVDETNTLSSMLREALEAAAPLGSFTSCVVYHPLDRHIEVTCSDSRTLRTALLTLKDRVQQARVLLL